MLEIPPGPEGELRPIEHLNEKFYAQMKRNQRLDPNLMRRIEAHKYLKERAIEEQQQMQ